MVSNCVPAHCALYWIGVHSIGKFKEQAHRCKYGRVTPRGIDGISRPARSNKILVDIQEKSWCSEIEKFVCKNAKNANKKDQSTDWRANHALQYLAGYYNIKDGHL